MQELYSTMALLKIKGMDTPRNAREAEDLFYAQAAQASRPWRKAKGVISSLTEIMQKIIVAARTLQQVRRWLLR